MLEMVPGFHTQKIVEEIFRLSENTSKSAPSSDNKRFDWLEKYINSDAGMECLLKYYRGVVPGGAGGAMVRWHPQILADQLTLSQPGGQIMPI